MASTDDTTQTQVRLPKALWEQIKMRAETERRSANTLVVILLEQAMGASGASRKNRQRRSDR